MSNTSIKNMIEIFSGNKIIPVFYDDEIEICKQVLIACYQAGLKVFEFTNRGQNALENFVELQRFSEEVMPGLLLGAGTIKSEEDAENFINAGASFIVSPVLQPAVVLHCRQKNIFHIPGCMTPTEIQEAINTGSKFIKLFPGNVLKADFVKAITPIFPGTLFMPTGGVEIEEKNLTDWFSAGVVCVGMGSNLISKKIIEEKNWNALRQNIFEAKKIINNINKQ